MLPSYKKMSEILSLYNKDNHSSAFSSSEVGQIGEELAAIFLEKKGYRLVLANFKVPVGQKSARRFRNGRN